MKEYLTIRMIAEHYNISLKTVYRRVDTLRSEHGSLMIRKSENNAWLVHHLLLSKFKPLRKRDKSTSSVALTIDFGSILHPEGIHKSMKCLFDYLDSSNVSLEYSIERKNKNNSQHIHALIDGSDSKTVTKKVYDLFRGLSICIKVVFDKVGWRKYISKESQTILLSQNYQ